MGVNVGELPFRCCILAWVSHFHPIKVMQETFNSGHPSLAEDPVWCVSSTVMTLLNRYAFNKLMYTRDDFC